MTQPAKTNFDEQINSRFYVYNRLFPSFKEMVQICLNKNIVDPSFYTKCSPQSVYHDYLRLHLTLIDDMIHITNIYISDEQTIQLNVDELIYDLNNDAIVKDCWIYDKYDDGGESWAFNKFSDFCIFKDKWEVLLELLEEKIKMCY